MIHIRTKYIVYTHTNGGVRHHNFSTLNNIIDASDDPTQPGENVFHTANGWPSLDFNGQQVPFAFMSVHGALDGNHLFTSPSNPQIPVGNTDIDILVVYAPPGGVGSGGGPGIWVDAFNVDTGKFSDSLDFITVLTPPTPPDLVDAPKSTFGNQEGEISTLTAENIRANHHVDGVPFLEWKKITQMPVIESNREIHLLKNQTNEIWFAFYQTKSASNAIADISERFERLKGKWESDDYCGTPPGHGPHGPFPFKINIEEAALRRLSKEQRAQFDQASRNYPEVANAAHAALTKLQGTLQTIAKSLTNKQ